MGTIMNENVELAGQATQPQIKWADLSLHTLRLVVACEPNNSRKRLCLIGPLSLGQRRLLEREGFYADQEFYFRDQLNFNLSQLLAIFPFARVIQCATQDLAVMLADLPVLQLQLRKVAALQPTIITTKPAAEQKHQFPQTCPALNIEPVPTSSRFASVRKYLSHAQFNTLKKAIFVRAGYRCEICLENGFEQGHEHPVELHEVFQYDDVRGVQKLTALMCVCPNCNTVKNIELSRAKGSAQFQAALQRLSSVNAWNETQAKSYYQHILEVWRERSKKDWELNLDLLLATGLPLPKDLTQTPKRPETAAALSDAFSFLNVATLPKPKLFTTRN